MKMLKRSAEVLNDTDAIERKLSWVLFKEENEQNLRVMHGEDWRPGNPLMVNSYYAELFLESYLSRPEYDTNYRRPMFELFEENDALSTEDTISLVNPIDYCCECDVSWTSENVEEISCWNCGQYLFNYTYESDDNLAKIQAYFASLPGETVNFFDDFDIDYNVHRVMMATRSGDMVRQQVLYMSTAMGMHRATPDFVIFDEAPPSESQRHMFMQWVDSNDTMAFDVETRGVDFGWRTPRSAVQFTRRFLNEPQIVWPVEGVSMEPDIPRPSAPFPEFRPQAQVHLPGSIPVTERRDA